MHFLKIKSDWPSASRFWMVVGCDFRKCRSVSFLEAGRHGRHVACGGLVVIDDCVGKLGYNVLWIKYKC